MVGAVKHSRRWGGACHGKISVGLQRVGSDAPAPADRPGPGLRRCRTSPGWVAGWRRPWGAALVRTGGNAGCCPGGGTVPRPACPGAGRAGVRRSRGRCSRPRSRGGSSCRSAAAAAGASPAGRTGRSCRFGNRFAGACRLARRSVRGRLGSRLRLAGGDRPA